MSRPTKSSLPLQQRPSKYQLFPPHPPDRHEALAESIDRHGVETSTVWDHQNNLLDGWEREAICVEKRITCPREVRHFATEADKFRFILAVNAHRRPCLSTQQKRDVVEAYLQGDPEIADNTLAQALGVSKNSVLKARQRLEIARRIPKAKKTRGRDGKLRPVKYSKRIITNSPNEFKKAQTIIKDLPDNCDGKTLDIITANRRARRNKKKEAREGRIIPPLPGDSIQIHHCRFQELETVAGITPGTVKLISTDIPYGVDFLPQLDDLGAFAQRVLADGSVFLCLCGQFHLNTVIASLDRHLTYRWTAASVWDGDANMIHPLQAASQWKPILVYSKGNWIERRRWGDIIRIDRKEKEWDAWQQPLELSKVLVEDFSNPGDLIVDPCGGGFTTAEGCLRQSRSFIGCDKSAECVMNGRERLTQARNKLNMGA